MILTRTDGRNFSTSFLSGGSLPRPLHELLESYYPGHEFLPWKLQPNPKGFWSSPSNVARFLSWCEKEFGITQKEQWYTKGMKDVVKLGGACSVRLSVLLMFSGKLDVAERFFLLFVVFVLVKVVLWWMIFKDR
jgi:hypothetical protein